jgi:hypothetical protein
MKQLPSGTRIGPPWPIAALNLFGPVARTAGFFPKITDPKIFRELEAELGRTDRSSAWVREGRTVRLKSFENDAKLSFFGALAVRAQLRKCFKNTLEFDRLIEEHPEIEKEEIRRPLFVVGWPRTGTTLLQRLLCLHQDARYIPVWEAYSILAEEHGRTLDMRLRRRRARRAMNLLKWVAPQLNAMHPMNLDDPDECYHLFRNYYAMPAGWDFAYLPSYWEWFRQQSAVPAYKAHKKQLQILQWYDRRGHWVLKSPQHLAGLPALMQVYPDARIIYTHRDPAEAMGSYCSLVAVAWGMTSDAVNLRRVADYVLTTAAYSQKIARETLPSIPKDQIYHVDYRDLTRNPKKTVATAYEHLGYPRDEGLGDRMDRWLQPDRPSGRKPHKYDLSDFGLTAEGVRRSLA